LGPAGVAWATLVAAVIALAVLIFFVMRGIQEVRIRLWSFVAQGLFVPFVPFLPLCLWIAVRDLCSESFPIPSGFAFVLTTVLSLLTVALIKRGIDGAQRLRN